MGAILVTGGAGYVGSHVVRALVEAGESVVVLDDLSTGHRWALSGATLVLGDFGDPALLDRVLGGGAIDCVIHMAACCEVGASILDPESYYRNNVAASLRLLEAVRRHGIGDFVFSSSAAVYGEPKRHPIEEDHSREPINPYGETKRILEDALASYHRAYGLRYVALRYFNAAGAHPAGDLGEDHAPETHLIPRLLQSTLPGAEPTPILGEDYPTPDGTCIRDYVHVVDLASAHLGARTALREGRLRAEALNLGGSRGASVREVLETVERVTGVVPAVRSAARRPGDPAILVASRSRAGERIGWSPKYELEGIVRTAWNWHRRKRIAPPPRSTSAREDAS